MISQTNKRVLLIDCDMRKGYTHELLGTNNVNGLSEILIGQGDITTAAKPTSIAKFDPDPARSGAAKSFRTVNERTLCRTGEVGE